jgi:hypothetical protein
MTDYRAKPQRRPLRVADLSGWEDDRYFQGFGQRSLRSVEVSIGRHRWYVERRTDAEGRVSIAACPVPAIRAAARRSAAAGGGVRGLCMDHVASDAVVPLSEDSDLMRVLA